MEKINRSQRNQRKIQRRHCRPLDIIHNENNSLYNPLPKRLFTPEIKELLKEWLTRRQENPYPNREEKKCLAFETGLTYTQICNWFANWRRKLKNSEKDGMITKTTSWGHLIKNYSTNVKGHVEQLSISSEDSIWKEDHILSTNFMSNMEERHRKHNSHNIRRRTIFVKSTKCNENIVTVQDILEEKQPSDWNESIEFEGNSLKCSKTELNKWLESAKKFTPNKHNWFIDWKDTSFKKNRLFYSTNASKLNGSTEAITTKETVTTLSSLLQNNQINNTMPVSLRQQSNKSFYHMQKHHSQREDQDELEAAEALTNLAFNCRQKMLKIVTSVNSLNEFNRTLNHITS